MMCLVSYTHVLNDTQEQYPNPLHGYVYIYHNNSVSNTFLYNDIMCLINRQSVM